VLAGFESLGILTPYATVRDHDGDPLSPGLSLVLRHGEPLTSHGDRCRPGSDRQHSRRPRGADIFCPPYAMDSSTETRFPHSAAWRASWRHCCCPVMSASGANTSCAHVLYPVPPLAMDAEHGHHTCHPCGQQRQRIERALAHPQRAVTLR
jgi:hypothetical protein